MLCKLNGAGHAQRLPDADQNLEAYCRGISSSREGTIQNNHRVIGISTNTSIVLTAPVVTYLMVTAEV